MFMKKWLSQLTMLWLLCVGAIAQERTLKGKVFDENGNALPGVSIVEKGTTRGVNTDANGEFQVNVSASTRLQLSFIGYESQEIVVGNRTSIDIRLKNDVNQLSEVVVVGYGVQRRREVTGAQAGVRGDEIQNMPVASFDRMLQGRAAGVLVNANNGIPGGATQVRIRGVGSISAGNNPLYIVDGVQIAPTDRSRSITSSNPLNGINPNDIESIEVLKDAAAASIYGAQAANGVIIITTKKGKAGKPQFEANVSTGTLEPTSLFNILNGPEWLELRREAAFNAGGQAALTALEGVYGKPENVGNYDWQKLILQQGLIQNAEISARGGTESSTYFIAGSFNNTKAHYIGTTFKRGTLRVNLDNKFSKKVSSETRLNFSVFGQNSSFVPAFNTNNLHVLALGRLPVDNPYNDDGSYSTSLRGILGAIAHPLALVEYNVNLGTTMQGIGNYALNYEIIPGLKFRSSYGLEFTEVGEENYNDPRTPAGGAGSVTDLLNTRVVNWQTDQTLTYNKIFNEKHNLQLLGGFNYRNEALNSLTMRGLGVATPAFRRTITGTTANTVASNYTNWRIASVFARAQYNFNEKYIVSATVRRDGVSRFGANKRFGIFPAGAVAWRISEEGFMKNQKIFNELKLRLSYGTTGNSDGIADFASRSLFSSPIAAGYSGQAGTTFAQLGNADLSWETNVSTNFGLDFGLLTNRITGSFDYFIRDTKDLLLNVPLPTTSGFTTIAKNVGSVRNSGIELGIQTRNLTGEFKWTTDFNIAITKNEVRQLLEAGKDLPNNGLFVGKPLGVIFAPRWAGVNPADGRAMWYDTLGHITYNPVAKDRVVSDRSLLVPKHFGGITNTFSYKGFELTAFVQWQMGHIGWNALKSFQGMDYRFDVNQDRDVLNRWTTPGQITHVPRLYPGANVAGSANASVGLASVNNGSDRFVEDASYVRLKQLTLSYSLPSKWISKLHLTNVRLYAQGVNLWTRTRFSPGFDPEFIANVNFGTGVANNNVGVIPPSKNYLLGVQIGF